MESFAILVVVEIEACYKLFRLGRIFIDFLLWQVVKVFIVYFYLERVFRRGLVIDPNLFKRM